MASTLGNMTAAHIGQRPDGHCDHGPRTAA
jgi:hypothetical protein